MLHHHILLANTGTLSLELALAFLLVLANGFFVASEFALTRVRSSQVNTWLSQKRPGAKAVKHAVEHIDSYLAACQLGITLASLALGAFGEPAIHQVIHPLLGESAKIGSLAIAGIFSFALITLLHVVVGELAPKSAAISRTDKLVIFLMPILRIFYILTRPLVQVFNGLGNLVLKPFGIPPAREATPSAFSQMELLQIVKESGENGQINEAERALTESVFEFDDRRIRDVMVPRTKVVTINSYQSVQEAAKTAMETGLTRLPICENDEGIDCVLGVLNAKDLLGVFLTGQATNLESLARPALKLADSTFVAMALREMKSKRTHLAIVIDEHGTAVGIVTVEDILEQLVGNIEDEFDTIEEDLIYQKDGTMFVKGHVPIFDLLQALGENPENVQFHEATFGGYILEDLGLLPEKGEKREFFGHCFEILEVEDGRIKLMSVPYEYK